MVARKIKFMVNLARSLEEGRSGVDYARGLPIWTSLQLLLGSLIISLLQS